MLTHDIHVFAILYSCIIILNVILNMSWDNKVREVFVLMAGNCSWQFHVSRLTIVFCTYFILIWPL